MTGGTLMVAIPCRSQVSATSFESLAWAMLEASDWWKKTRGPDAKFGLCVVARAHIVDARIEIMRSALEQKADYVWWLDDDMIVPPNALPRLMLAMEEHQAALSGALCFRRGPPYTPCAFGFKHSEDGKPLTINPMPVRVAEVSVTGFACILMDMKRAADVWDMTDGAPFMYAKGMGEDGFYCRQAARFGQKIVVDTGVVPGHIGEFAYDGKSFVELVRQDPNIMLAVEPEEIAQ